MKYINSFNICARFLVCFLFIIGCNKDTASSKLTKSKISRVVSLSPSISRQLIDMGAGDTLVGITSYCPPAKNAQVVGTIVNPNVEKIMMLNPHVILYSHDDSNVQKSGRIQDIGFDTYLFKRSRHFSDIATNYMRLAKMVKKEKSAQKLLDAYNALLTKRRKEIQKALNGKRPRVAFFVSLDPLVAATGVSYINNIINDSGGMNVYSDLKLHFPRVSIESLVKLNPDIVISMHGMTRSFFKDRLGSLKEMKVLFKDNVYSVTNKNIPFFTPGDYIKSVETVSDIVLSWIKKTYDAEI